MKNRIIAFFMNIVLLSGSFEGYAFADTSDSSAPADTVVEEVPADDDVEDVAEEAGNDPFDSIVFERQTDEWYREHLSITQDHISKRK